MHVGLKIFVGEAISRPRAHTMRPYTRFSATTSCQPFLFNFIYFLLLIASLTGLSASRWFHR